MNKEVTLEIKRFSGLYNVDRPENAKKGNLHVARNIDIDNSGNIRRRVGYESVHSGDIHSVTAAGADVLFREGVYLKRYAPSGSIDTLRSDFIGSNRLSSILVNDSLYYSDGLTKGVYQEGVSRSWGLEIPPQPVVTATSGDLLVGNYAVSLTYGRNDGQESGASTPVYCNATEGGFVISNILPSADSGVSDIIVYISTVDGEILWRQAVLSNTAASLAISGGIFGDGVECKTLNMSPLPASRLITWYRGRMYAADGPVIWYSEPWNYELTQLDRNFMAFNDTVTMITPTENGLWVGTSNEVQMLFGNDPMTEGGFQVKLRDKCGAIFGAYATISKSILGIDNLFHGRTAIWASRDGIMVGDSVGTIINVTGDYFIPPDVDEGWATYIPDGGMDRVLFGFNTRAGYGTSEISVTIG